MLESSFIRSIQIETMLRNIKSAKTHLNQEIVMEIAIEIEPRGFARGLESEECYFSMEFALNIACS